MIRTDLLRGKIAEKGYTYKEMATKLGIVPITFRRKMEKGVFASDEMEKLVEVLAIENPAEIFFAK